MLATADAHSLYRSYGFEDLPNPGRFLVVQQSAAVLYAAANGEAVGDDQA
jgi:hypothetical protein